MTGPAKDTGPKLEYYKSTREYANVFLKEVPKLPPRWEIDFSIHLVPWVTLVSKASYQMSTPELLELKL